ncbi:thioesterase family protein [Panacibacter sp. DH6]|uniref:Thioesterase family protein n=1 Tax=Panacibacter microcysteis TaxID=2793269 RepID=A0A931DZN1_9BACT|nr:thioesterase family protein [Panacibacter microcysteis]MBG9374730.1 thioesterase family protein [Panacibacter microcysteis]
MERVKVNLPDVFSFSVELRIRITDLNFGGHVGNDTFLSLLHEARHEYLKRHGYGEVSFEGAGLIMADAAIEYKKELVQGDDIKISVVAAGFDKYGFDLFYKIEVNQPGGYALAAKAKTGMLCFDYAKRKIALLPGAAQEKLQALTA